MSFILEQIISSFRTIYKYMDFMILRPFKTPPKLIKYQEVANLTKNQINAHLLYNDVVREKNKDINKGLELWLYIFNF